MGRKRTFNVDILKASKADPSPAKLLSTIEVLTALVIICAMLIFKFIGQ